jgi:hypothetical protein
MLDVCVLMNIHEVYIWHLLFFLAVLSPCMNIINQYQVVSSQVGALDLMKTKELVN